MRIAILGSGMVGGTLGRRWARLGHQVTWGRRDPDEERSPSLLDAGGPTSRVATIARACAAGDVVVLATPWSAVEESLAAAGDLGGKVLLDCTNPLKPDLSGLELGFHTSGGERIAALVPGARVVKAFNSVGVKVMERPTFGPTRATLLLCGDDPEAKGIAAVLGQALGFEVVDAGPLSQSRLLEAAAMLWISLAFAGGIGPDFAFVLLRR